MGRNPCRHGSSADEGFDNSCQGQSEFDPATLPPTRYGTLDIESTSVLVPDKSGNASGGRRLIDQTRPDAKSNQREMTDEEVSQNMSEIRGIYDDILFGDQT